MDAKPIRKVLVKPVRRHRSHEVRISRVSLHSRQRLVKRRRHRRSTSVADATDDSHPSTQNYTKTPVRHTVVSSPIKPVGRADDPELV